MNSRIDGAGTYCKAGWVIDGGGGPILQGVLLEIKDGMIVALGPDRGRISLIRPAADLELLDFSDCTILPGLMDSHVHLTMSGTTNLVERKEQLENGYAPSCALIRAHLKDHWTHGILAVRDGGDHNGYVARFKTENPVREQQPVVIQSAGRAFHGPGRYGRLIGRSPWLGQSLSQAVAMDQDPKDHVKIINSGLNSLKEYGRQTACQFDAVELRNAVGQARRRGLETMIHANGELPVKESIAAGCRSIEHGFFMREDNLKRMADSRTIWVPTAVTMAAYAGLMRKDSPEQVVARKNLDHQLGQIAAAKKAGVVMAIGTDAGSPGVNHGQAFGEELALFMEAGHSIAEALKCAAMNAAGLLGLEGRGRIYASGTAEFIVVKGPPADLPASLRNIQAIYMDGQLRYRAG